MNRRDFLKQTPPAVAAVSFLRTPSAASGEPPRSPVDHETLTLPPHRALRVPGVHAYAEKSVAAGEAIHFRVSSTAPYGLSVCRLGTDVDNFESDEVLHIFPKAEPEIQEIHPGSYVHVGKGLPSEKPLRAITLECWLRPWKFGFDQGLITQYDPSSASGFGLYLVGRGWLKFRLGDSDQTYGYWESLGPLLTKRRWHHVALSWDGKVVTFYLDGRFQGSWAWQGTLKPARVPLRLAAAGKEGKADDFFDGELCMPILYDRALSPAEIQGRFEAQGLHLPELKGVLACWPFREEAGDGVADASGHRRDGRIINRGTWMIGGPSFDSAAVSRHTEYDPRKDSTRGHALRFASDDLYDCRWNVTEQYPVPKGAKSGIYAGRFRFEEDGASLQYHVTFIVRKAPDRSKAPILLLCSTNTWQAYSATPFAANAPDRQQWDTGGLPNATPGSPSYSCYRNHHEGQPAYEFGMNMPWPVAGPDVLFSKQEVGYSHLMRGERFTHSWLEQTGYDYDVVTDYDLHRNPEMLKDYRVLIINGHSEYWSVEAYEGVDQFLRDGGNVIVLSGNTMFWRVTFDDKAQVMECRKYDAHIGGRPSATVGELYHSHDKKRGSLMRYCGFPAWKVLGLECIGWWGLEKEDFGIYEAAQTHHFLFHRPHPVGLRNGETFGHAPDGGLPRVGGHESDVRLPRIRQITKHFPEGASFPEEPTGITTLARIVKKGRRGINYFGLWEPLEHGVIAEMIYWERPQGGRVFHGGCIAGGWALSRDPKFQALMRNVLHHFGAPNRKA